MSKANFQYDDEEDDFGPGDDSDDSDESEVSDESDDSDDSDDESDELSAGEISEIRPAPQSGMRRRLNGLANNQGRRLRIRPMKKGMVERHPNVVSLLITREDGRQLMFVRK